MGKFKNSINISSTCPNSIILYKGIYSLKSIWEIQIEALISNFTNRLNDTETFEKLPKIRLKDVQILNWEPTNIIKVQMSPQFRTKDNLQANILNLAHSLEITYKGFSLYNIFEYIGGNHSI